ncbi:sensor histidine kinase [Microbacterium sp. NPDC058389]|uniref:sensor histidine kinase n=1 Tax=Microbacterium sp. NPDC058389 TaxID=3346475 RepID=UPI00365B056D
MSSATIPRRSDSTAAGRSTDVTALMGSPAFVVVVFVATLTLVLSNAVVAILDGASSWDNPLPQSVVVALIVVGCGLQAACLLLVRRHPVLGVAGTLVAYLAVVVLVAVPAWTAAMQLVVAVALFALATRARAVTSVLWLAIAIAATVATLTLWAVSLGAPAGVVAGFVINQSLAFAAPAAAATALGLLWAAHSRHAAEAREAADRLTREQEARMAEARDIERARIAQELHDVTAQHIAGLVSLCDASIELAPQQPEQALQLIDEVRTEGRFAAASLYGALGDLRTVDSPSATVTPDLRDVEELVAFWSRRGMTVELHVLGDIPNLPAVVSTIAYRGVQEALANAAKHAPGSTVHVNVVVHSDRMHATVSNGAATRAHSAEERLGLGWGLDGLRDKLHLIDGTLHAADDGRGGWRTRLTIPFPDIEGHARG